MVVRLADMVRRQVDMEHHQAAMAHLPEVMGRHQAAMEHLLARRLLQVVTGRLQADTGNKRSSKINPAQERKI
jgi:hypothetical protein